MNETEVPLLYANQFSIKKITDSDGTVFSLITIKDGKTGQNFLVVPQNKSPEKILKSLPAGTQPLFQPLCNAYLVSSSAMDLIVSCGALENISFSGTKKSDWYVEEAAKAMESGKIAYAGKYSAPDYELLVSKGCSLAIQNNMIYHKPEVMEKLTELDIPCLVEKSGNESHPLGRFEWIKLYGVLFGKEKEAQTFFDNRIKAIQGVLNQKKTDKTVTFFYINKNGSVNVRTDKDYIAGMIELAGGNYIPKLPSKDEDNNSTKNIQVEDFFALAKDADIIVYNAIVDRPIESIKELEEKNEVFTDFKAVKNKRVYCVGREFFQSTTAVTQFITDMNGILNGDESNLVYIKRID